jgi:cyclophilin family peptidyl-prolyl cis-trans isomerase
MIKRILAALFGAAVAGAAAPAIAADTPRVVLTTNQGAITIELYPDKAPVTVKNFLDYVRAGHYDGTIFHRVIRNFMIQGGGFVLDPLREKPTRGPIRNEADNGLRNDTGTVAMARTPDPNSATAQFFINTHDNDFLNFKAKTAEGYGYAVFGRVVEGMDVVLKIEGVATTTYQGVLENFPVDPVIIESVKVVGEK